MRLTSALRDRAREIIAEMWPWLELDEIDAIAKIIVEAYEKR